MTVERQSGVAGAIARLFVAEKEELPAVLAGFVLFFLLFTSYFMLRPVRETMGIAGGVDNLPWLFMGTFLVTLAVVPFYGWLSARVSRRQLVPAAYLIVAASLAGFGGGMAADPDNVWLGRAFYIWLSMLNLFVVSLGWSLMADVFRPGQAKRVFAPMAAGASLGGLCGPAVSLLLVEPVGHSGLLFISAGLLASSLVAVAYLLRWRAAHGPAESAVENAARPIGGSVLAGITLVARSPYLLGISFFVLLLVSASTFLYFQQARLVEATFETREAQTQVFAAIDVAVQSLTILIQLFVTGRLSQKLGVTVLLTAVPLLMVAGFLALAVAGAFPVLVAVIILRRVGEYALVRPGREMLFTTVDNETKYKAKNAIDTVVYRGGDMVSAWIETAINALGGAMVVALLGAALAAVWAGVGWKLGRIHDHKAAPV